MRYVATLCLILGLSSVGAIAEQRQDTSVRVDAAPLAKFRMARDDEPIFLPVTFGGKEYSFILDTGSSVVAFNSRLRGLLGKPTGAGRAGTSGGEAAYEVFAAPQAFLGPLSLKDCNEVACLDLTMMDVMSGRRVDGIIGISWLSKYIIRINFDEGTVCILPSSNMPQADWGTGIPMDFGRIGLPEISGAIPGAAAPAYELQFMVDTGDNGAGALRSDVFSHVLRSQNARSSQGASQTVGGTTGHRELRLAELSVANINYHGLVFSEAGGNTLGLGFLSRHIVTFDFPHHKIYLKEGKGFNKADETNMSGMGLIRKDGRTIVFLFTYNDSPAEQAGIKTGDVILKVDGKDADSYGLFELRTYLKRDGQKVTMTVKRGSDVNDVSFVLRRKI
jgi:hypothetical protein